MCTGRIDLAFVLRAFEKGADGVFIAGCRINECNYLTHGNFYALSLVGLAKRLINYAGFDPERLSIELLSGGEANRFVDIVDGFSEKIRALGPVYSAEGESGPDARLEELARLVPYIKIRMKDKLTARLQSERAYDRLYTQNELEEFLANVDSYYIAPARCQACMVCAKRCPVDAIEGGKRRIHVIDQGKCIKCGRCFEVCPKRFAAVDIYSGEPAPPPISKDERIIDRKKKEG